MTPCEPSKYASRRRARKPFSPMMSHTIMSSIAGAPRHSTSTVFFVTFVPIVAMYRSSNSSWTNRRMREVFPTATSPTKHTLALTCFRPVTAGVAIMRLETDSVLCTVRTRFSSMIILILPRRLSARIALRDALRQGLEGGLDVDAGLRRCEMERAVVGPCGLDHFVLRNLELVLQVDLVPQEFDRDLAGHAVDALDPVVQVVERLAARHVAHRENAASAVEVGLLEQLPESLLAHDVPDRHVDLQLASAVGTGRGEFLLRDLRAKGLNVLVIEVVEHESPDEGGLADCGFADETNLHLHPLDIHKFPPGTGHTRRDPLKRYGSVILGDN